MKEDVLLYINQYYSQLNKIAAVRFDVYYNDSYYYNNVTAVNTTITGNITFSSGSNITGLVSPGYDTKAGVDVSGLTITQN